MLSGFINLNKPQKISSNKYLTILKRILKDNNIDTKVGHMGTLDPDAEGVLPVALGRGTRLFDYMLEKKKVYYAHFTFGIETDTLDSSGETIFEDENIEIDIIDIKKVLPALTGEIEQMPPKYSAKSINGQRAYKLVREGKEFQLKTKKIYIYSIELLKKIRKNVFSFRIICSGGTYIRSIARDMAMLLGTKGIMSYLQREMSGIFSLENSITVVELEKNLEKYILPIDFPIQNLKSYEVNEKYQKHLLNGVKLKLKGLPDEKFFKVYCKNELIGIGEEDNENRMVIKTWLL